MAVTVFKDALGQTIELGDTLLSFYIVGRGSLRHRRCTVSGFTDKFLKVEGHVKSHMQSHNAVILKKAPVAVGDMVRVTAPVEGANEGVFPVTKLQGNYVELGDTKFSRPVAEVDKVDE